MGMPETVFRANMSRLSPETTKSAFPAIAAPRMGFVLGVWRKTDCREFIQHNVHGSNVSNQLLHLLGWDARSEVFTARDIKQLLYLKA